MTSRLMSAVAALAAACMCADATEAAPVSFTGSAAVDSGIEASIPGAPIGPSAVLGSALIDKGIDFSFGRAEGMIEDIDPTSTNSDPFFLFCGVNGEGVCDLQTGIDGRIVRSGTSLNATTRHLELEAGFFDEDSNPLLRVFDADANLLTSVTGVRGTAATGQQLYARLLFKVERDTADIAFFDFGLPEGEDDFQGFGVSRISLETPVVLPAPGTLGLMGLGLLAVGALRRRDPTLS